MKKEISERLYKTSLIISFISGVILAIASFVFVFTCSFKYTESVTCPIRMAVFFFISLAIFIISLLIRFFSKTKNKKRWEDIYPWIIYIFLFLIFRDIMDNSINYFIFFL